MDETIKQELEKLIEEGISYENKFQHHDRNKIIRGRSFPSQYYTLPKDSEKKLTEWLEDVRYWTRNNYESDFENINRLVNNCKNSSLSPVIPNNILAKLKAM